MDQTPMQDLRRVDKSES